MANLNSLCFGMSLVVATMSVATLAGAQDVCGDHEKAYVAKALGGFEDPTSKDALAAQAELYEKFKYCAAAGESTSAKQLATTAPRYCGKPTYVGSLSYEQMRCCGYDPQKQLFGCPVEIKRPTGFGTAPFPGSQEHVLTCVDYGGGLVPVARDDVHLANAVSGSPIWNFAVIARVRDPQFAATPLLGQTYRARSILSWNFVPTSCNYTPIWGNWLDYKIRLDP